MDRLQAMQLFTRIVELGSFSRAAEQLSLPRASATQVIKRLEAHLGVRLLQRTTRQVTTTLDGAAYYQRCLAILGDIEEVEASFSQASRQPRGRLKVDLPASLGRLVVIPALPSFCERFPLVELEMGIGDRQVDLVREGVDCVLRLGELRESSLVARTLAPLDQVTCASADYLARYGMPRSLAEFGGHRAVGFASVSAAPAMALDFLKEGQLIHIPVPTTLSVNNGDAYLAACEAGLGIVQVPRYRVAEQLAEGALVEILPDLPPPVLPLAILYPHQRHLSPRVRVFVDWLVDLFSMPPVCRRPSRRA